MSTARIAEGLSGAEAFDAALRGVPSGLAAGAEIWLVGGAIRDALLGRRVTDVDLLTTGSERELAVAVARANEATPFELSDEFGGWRVCGPQNRWQVDVVGLRAAGLEGDLHKRDFTINAIALKLAGDGIDMGVDPVDPTGGIGDVEAELLRAASAQSFTDDPLRVLRLARIGAELGFEVDAASADLARDAAPGLDRTAPERQFAELRSMIGGPDPVRAIELCEQLAAIAVVLPELAELRGVEQNPYHQHDVHGHTIEVLRRTVELTRDPGGSIPGADEQLITRIEAALAEPLADQMTRGEAMRWAALVHDMGKPETKGALPDGRITFMGHDEAGAAIAETIARRLRTSRAFRNYLESLARHHLRLGFLVHEAPLDRGAIWEYLTRTDPFSLDVTLFTVADRLATKGPKTRTEAIDSHLALVTQLAGEALEFQERGAPELPLPGDELAAEVGIDPGPRLGELITALRRAIFVGDVPADDRAATVKHARTLLG